MSRKNIRHVLSVLVIAATFVFLVYYWHTHPEIVSQLQSVSITTVAAVMGLYLTMTVVLVLIYDTILRLCDKPIPLGEHTLLTIYSSIINFFGPLQSGPGFRTIYLKQRHSVPVKSYVTGTLLYYILFGIFNLAFLAIAILSFGALPLALALLAASVLAARYLTTRVAFLHRFKDAARSPLLGRLAALTFLQTLLTVAIYAIELQAVGEPASLLQIVGYTGAGSLALFVSLTPGALGFRESFQYFSQSIHHIDSTTIVTTNVLDRSVYVVFLGALFLFIIATHAKRRLKVSVVNKTSRTRTGL